MTNLLPFSLTIFCLLPIPSLVGSVCAAEYESRIWTDKSGKHQIKAKFIDVVDGKVRLERPNGDISRVPIEKLSEADQDYVNDSEKRSPKETPARPTVQGLQVGDRVEAEHFGKWQPAIVVEINFKRERVEVQIEGGSDFEWEKSLDELRYPKTLKQPVLVKPPSPVSQLKTIRPNYKDMKRLLADGAPSERIEADPLPLGEGAWEPRAVRLTSANDFLAKVSNFQRPSDFAIVTEPTPMAMIVYEEQGFDEEAGHVQLVDLSSQKVVLDGPAPPGTGKVVMSPDGGSIATFRSEFGGADGDGRVDFWKLDDKKVDHWISFAPYVMNTWPSLDPDWIAWLDDQRLFTVNKEGQLFLWEVEGGKAVYELQVGSGTNPILTHGGKHLVVPTSHGIQFFESDTGNLEAVVGAGNYRYTRLAFSPSGKQLAIASHGFIDVLDVTTGETTRSFPCEDVGFLQNLAWIDEEFLITGNGLILHVPLRVIAWKYEIDSPLIKSFAGDQWSLLGFAGNNGLVLTPLDLPPPEATAAIENLNEDDLLVVRPGDAISIDVQIHDNNFLAQDVEQALKDALAAAEMRVEDDAELKLVARTKSGETESVRYYRFGALPRDAGETIEVTSRIYELELTLNGGVVWRRESVHSAPHHVRLEKGETIRAAVDRVLKPSAVNFMGRLPAYVVRPEYRGPQGTSKLSLGP